MKQWRLDGRALKKACLNNRTTIASSKDDKDTGFSYLSLVNVLDNNLSREGTG